MNTLKNIFTPVAGMICSAVMLSAAVTDPSPVPEPASVVMMGAGLAGVAFMGWKRKQKK
jgi:hypothetical protein